MSEGFAGLQETASDSVHTGYLKMHRTILQKLTGTFTPHVVNSGPTLFNSMESSSIPDSIPPFPRGRVTFFLFFFLF